MKENLVFFVPLTFFCACSVTKGSLQKEEETRLISIESQPKKIVVVAVIGVGLVVVHVVAVVIPVVDTRNIPNKVWLKPGY